MLERCKQLQQIELEVSGHKVNVRRFVVQIRIIILDFSLIFALFSPVTFCRNTSLFSATAPK